MPTCQTHESTLTNRHSLLSSTDTCRPVKRTNQLSRIDTLCSPPLTPTHLRTCHTHTTPSNDLYSRINSLHSPPLTCANLSHNPRYFTFWPSGWGQPDQHLVRVTGTNETNFDFSRPMNISIAGLTGNQSTGLDAGHFSFSQVRELQDTYKSASLWLHPAMCNCTKLGIHTAMAHVQPPYRNLCWVRGCSISLREENVRAARATFSSH
jgi:hypothetical protein